MLRRIPRLLRSAFVVAVLLAVSASVYQSWAAGQPGMAGWQQTQWGPVGPADRNLLQSIRLAGLWEGPTGQQAEQQANTAEVREVGRRLAIEHAQLDAEARRVADQLGILLPSAPSTTQMDYMDQISRQRGAEYDRTFVQLVRQAHGQVLPVISETRASTQNELVREFANTAAETVTRHHGYLESTGLVDYSALPHRGPGLFGGGTQMTDLIVPFLVFLAALLGAVALFWTMRNRTPGTRERVTVPRPEPTPRLRELTAVIPGPRRGGLAAAPAGLEDTGPIQVINGTVGDSGDYPTDVGSYRAVTDTDSGHHRRARDSESHPVPTSGSHRIPRPRARHSTQR
jgi:predicted outer membrane protein